MRRTWQMMLMVMVMLAAVAGPVGAQGGEVIGPNLLRNPGFDGPYNSYGTVLEFRVAPEWHPWYTPQEEGDPNWRNRRPEYRPATYVYEGLAAQQFFASYGTHQAGLWQQVAGVTPGATYRFSLAVYIWSSMEDDPLTSVNPAVFGVRVGIDPAGGTDPYAESVVWSPFETFYDAWQVLSVETVAQADVLTVFFWSQQSEPVVHNDVAVDAAALAQVNPAVVEATEEVSVSGEPASSAPPSALTEPEPTGPAVGVFTPDVNLRLRAAPGGEMLATVPFGIDVPVYGRSADDDWVLIAYDGVSGWVASWLGVYSIPFAALPVLAP